MAVSRLLKDHFFLVAGITLPVVVVSFFLLAQYLPSRWVDPPRHDLFFVCQQFERTRSSALVQVVDSKLEVQWSHFEEPEQRSRDRLFRYDAASDSVEEVPLTAPKSLLDQAPSATQLLDPWSSFLISSHRTAPDGYEYEWSRYRHSGILEIFGGTRRKSPATISKGGRRIPIPHPGLSWQEPRFLGWVIAESRDE